jgi:hypothetical protein
MIIRSSQNFLRVASTKHFRSFGWGWGSKILQGSSKEEQVQQVITNPEPLLSQTTPIGEQLPFMDMAFQPSSLISPAIEKLKSEAHQFSNFIVWSNQTA